MIRAQSGKFFQTKLHTIPITARPYSTPNKLHPQAPRSPTRQTGAYVPAISRKMATWSKRINLMICCGLTHSEWYSVDAVYSTIKLTPNTAKLTVCQTLPCASISSMTRAAMERAIPSPCDRPQNGSRIKKRRRALGSTSFIFLSIPQTHDFLAPHAGIGLSMQELVGNKGAACPLGKSVCHARIHTGPVLTGRRQFARRPFPGIL